MTSKGKRVLVNRGGQFGHLSNWKAVHEIRFRVTKPRVKIAGGKGRKF